jgi:hypothetical protein
MKLCEEDARDGFPDDPNEPVQLSDVVDPYKKAMIDVHMLFAFIRSRCLCHYIEVHSVRKDLDFRQCL